MTTRRAIRRVPLAVLGVCLSGALLASASLRAEGAGLRIREKDYRHKKAASTAYVIENDRYAATLVPSRGGRILEWIDKKTNRDVIYDNGYGGLLDDHGARFRKPYKLEWIQRSPREVAARLTLQDGAAVYQRTVRFFAERPVIQVTYHLENHGQHPARMLFRNVVRPSGAAFTGRELYCYSRVVGLQRAKGMPRTDDQADPWCALVDPQARTTVAAAFDGDALERLYTWRGSKVAPTFEFMFHQLEPGKQMDVTYWWILGHGLTAVDYAHRNFTARIEGALRGGQLTADLDLVATWAPMPDLKVSGQVLDPKRKRVASIKPVAVPVRRLDEVARLPIRVAAPGAGKYAILVLKLESKALPGPVVVEKPFPLNANARLLADYRRPVRWLGKPVVQRPVPGWTKEQKYVIQPDATDRRRGCMVFEEAGPRAGKRADALEFELAQREPESFPLHFHSLSRSGAVDFSVQAPEGIAVETFVPEKVPQKLWGRMHYGLKLNPGARFTVKPGDDRVLYFRLRPGDVKPGVHTATITFTPNGAAPIRLPVRIKVHPVRFPRHPFMVFDVNNVVNYLCATAKTYRWAPKKAAAYLGDMERHGVRGQTMAGINAPSAHYWNKKVRVRETGESLTEAIRKDPSRFRERLDLPALDFSEWDPLTDILLRHGQTHTKWSMGNCGPTFIGPRLWRLTKTVYGRGLPFGDLRDMALQEWYFRELSRWLHDRGIVDTRVVIDDEIPSEELAWWVQHAFRCIQMGLEPGVTQSAATVADTQRINFVAPFMKYWIIGTLHKPTLDLRRRQGIIRPEHWVTTYHSSANHWRPYKQTRGHCGLNPAYFDLDACWIQVYWRWRQSEAIIYPSEDGPTSSAAWEGARDGLDDGNYLLLARALIAALPSADARKAYARRLEDIVGERDTSFIRFTDRETGVGLVTTMGQYHGKVFKAGYDTARFRQAKRRLLALVRELTPKAPVQKAAADFGRHHPLIRDGRFLFSLPTGMKRWKEAVAFVRKIAGPLALDPPKPQAVDARSPYPVFFLGTPGEMKSLLPNLAAHPDLADLGPRHPAPGAYVIRFVRKPPPRRRTEKPAPRPESMLILAADEPGLQKALTLLPNVVTPPKSLYSHWLLGHWER